jgi:signal recognition particle subunit SRP68
MKFKFGKGRNYQKANIEKVAPNDTRTLEVLLFNAEASWAYAMDLKQSLAQNNAAERIKFHIRKKFKRAQKWSALLEQLTQDRTEKRSAKETRAYAAFMAALAFHECNRFELALRRYIDSRDLYSELLKQSDTLQGVVYRERIELIDQSIRFCYKKVGGNIFDSIDVILKRF